MRAIVQRVTAASVSVDDVLVGSCGKGLCLLVGVRREDDPRSAKKLAEKIVNLRIFNDEDGKMNHSLLELSKSQASCGILAISNFTVYGDTSKSRRPSFLLSAPYETGRDLFNMFIEELKASGIRTETGIFGADMQVSLINDGPVTVIVEA